MRASDPAIVTNLFQLYSTLEAAGLQFGVGSAGDDRRVKVVWDWDLLGFFKKRVESSAMEGNFDGGSTFITEAVNQMLAAEFRFQMQKCWRSTKRSTKLPEHTGNSM